MNEVTAISWDHVASAFGAITMLLLGYLIYRQGHLEDKVDDHIETQRERCNGKMSASECKETRAECERLKHHAVECDVLEAKKMVEYLAETFEYHTHTGLPPEATMVRRRNNRG
jgi:hypothetical protein